MVQKACVRGPGEVLDPPGPFLEAWDLFWVPQASKITSRTSKSYPKGSQNYPLDLKNAPQDLQNRTID